MTGPAEELQLLLGGGGLLLGSIRGGEIRGLELGDILEVRNRLCLGALDQGVGLPRQCLQALWELLQPLDELAVGLDDV